MGPARIIRSCLLMAARLPMSQNVMAGSLSYGSARTFSTEMSEVNTVPTKIPVSTRNSVGSPRRSRPANMYATSTAASPKASARICVTTTLFDSMMPSAAPNPAPADAPRMSGDTSGLRNIPW